LLLESVTKSIAELIVVVDRTNHEWLYTNHEVSNYVPNQESAEELKEILNYKIDDYGKEKESAGTEQSEPLQSLIELMGEDGSLCQYFSVVGYPITWMEHKSIVLLLVDVTEEQRERMQLEQVAYYDTLTKTYSRHYGMKTLERWVAEKRTLVIAFVDMDGLKYVNDTFGHAAGDEYILATSELLRSFDSDAIICRLGGDEFMLLARSSTTSQAREKLELMRIQLAQGFEGAYERSFSFGLVEVDATNTKSASLLLSMADENMYEDKRSRKKERRAQV
jgi:diguanylate cyclase (GGDEF)-like protein